MTSTKFLSGVAALALIVAAPSASFAAWRGGGGARMGGGPVMGARMGGSPTFHGGARIAGGPSASFAAAGPRTVGAATTWNGGRAAWNGRGNWNGGWRYNGGRWWPGAVAAGAALGAYAAYGGAGYYDYGPGYYDDTYYDNTYYDNGYYDDGATVAVVPGGVGVDANYCAQRYRSYDPASGTYLGYDGLQHPCP